MNFRLSCFYGAYGKISVSVSTLFTHSEKSISCGFDNSLILNIYTMNLAGT